MSATADLVYQNFIDNITAITPTNQIPGKNFNFIDFKRLEPDQSSGLTRAFTVHWLSSDSDEEPTDYTDRIAVHTFEVQVIYTTEYATDTLNKVMLQDRHDIIKKLRSDTNFIANQYSCIRKSDRVEMNSKISWLLRMTWTCHIKENEY